MAIETVGELLIVFTKNGRLETTEDLLQKKAKNLKYENWGK